MDFLDQDAQTVVEHLLVHVVRAVGIGASTAIRKLYELTLMPEWKDTVNLPRTGFPMKANLQTAEPEALARWEAMDLYGADSRSARRGAPKFVLHDGPPYANGQIHLGTALNKILKDLVVKSKIDGRLRRAVRPRLRLPRPADRAEGRSRARPEEARHVDGRHPPRLPRLRRSASST